MPRGGFVMKLLMLKLQGPSSAPLRPWEDPRDVLMWTYIVKFAKNTVF